MAFPDIPNVHALAALLLTVLALFLLTPKKIPLESSSLFILVALIIGSNYFRLLGLSEKSGQRTSFTDLGTKPWCRCLLVRRPG